MTRRSLLLSALQTPAPPSWLTERLAWFQDLRFGLFLHWGAYSQLGCIESWPLVWADRKWSNPGMQTKEEMAAFRRKYFALPYTFNPKQFDPDRWADLAFAAGMRYVMFTTKHHDGFSLFNTTQTDYRVTHPRVPFSRDKRANITREVFRAFGERGMGIGAYFSKSDWHSPYYWRPDRFAEDRNPNYDTAAEPERWKRFVEFAHGQVRELMTDYGKVDILWLDGGQVRPPKQDIDLPRMAAMARKLQPGLLVVNRTANDGYEDYRTPEQEVPEVPPDYVWESCITMGTQWSFKPDDRYKSARDLIHLLVNVVSKGGNLLLNIGPQPDGQLPAEAVARLQEIGTWMTVNGEAIWGTRAVVPYASRNVRFTRRGRDLYVIVLRDGTESDFINIQGLRPTFASQPVVLGSDMPVSAKILRYEFELQLGRLPREWPSEHAIVVKMPGALA